MSAWARAERPRLYSAMQVEGVLGDQYLTVVATIFLVKG